MITFLEGFMVEGTVGFLIFQFLFIGLERVDLEELAVEFSNGFGGDEGAPARNMRDYIWIWKI